MIVDGTTLLRMVKDNKFEDGDEIVAETTRDNKYVYSAYYRNFTSKNTGNQLTVQQYIFWTFDVSTKPYDIDCIEEMKMSGVYNTNEIIVNRAKINEIIRKVNEINREIKKYE